MAPSSRTDLEASRELDSWKTSWTFQSESFDGNLAAQITHVYTAHMKFIVYTCMSSSVGIVTAIFKKNAAFIYVFLLPSMSKPYFEGL